MSTVRKQHARFEAPSDRICHFCRRRVASSSVDLGYVSRVVRVFSSSTFRLELVCAPQRLVSPTLSIPYREGQAFCLNSGRKQPQTCSNRLAVMTHRCFDILLMTSDKVTLHAEFNCFKEEGMGEDQTEGQIGHEICHDLSPGTYKYYFMVNGRRRLVVGERMSLD